MAQAPPSLTNPHLKGSCGVCQCAVNTPIIPLAVTSPWPPKTNSPKCSNQHVHLVFFWWITCSDQASGAVSAPNSVSCWHPAGPCPPRTASPNTRWAVTSTWQVCVVFGGQRTEPAVLSMEWVWKAACFTWIKQLLTLSQKRPFGLYLLQE